MVLHVSPTLPLLQPALRAGPTTALFITAPEAVSNIAAGLTPVDQDTLIMVLIVSRRQRQGLTQQPVAQVITGTGLIVLPIQPPTRRLPVVAVRTGMVPTVPLAQPPRQPARAVPPVLVLLTVALGPTGTGPTVPQPTLSPRLPQPAQLGGLTVLLPTTVTGVVSKRPPPIVVSATTGQEVVANQYPEVTPPPQQRLTTSLPTTPMPTLTQKLSNVGKQKLAR